MSAKITIKIILKINDTYGHNTNFFLINFLPTRKINNRIFSKLWWIVFRSPNVNKILLWCNLLPSNTNSNYSLRHRICTIADVQESYRLSQKLFCVFVLFTQINIISIVWRNWIRLKLISSSYLPIDCMYFPAVRENTIQHDRADSIGRVLLR